MIQKIQIKTCWGAGLTGDAKSEWSGGRRRNSQGHMAPERGLRREGGERNEVGEEREDVRTRERQGHL